MCTRQRPEAQGAAGAGRPDGAERRAGARDPVPPEVQVGQAANLTLLLRLLLLLRSRAML